MNNGSKIILDLCGGTGAWSDPYKKAGYDVRVITLPHYNILEYEPPKNVYGILAAPPCTMFSLARTTAKTPRDLRGSMEIVKACLNIIWEARLEGTLKFWALENPVGLLRQFLGKPVMTFHPWEFGDPWTKRTDLWGYFNEPRKSPVKLTQKQLWDSKNNTRSLPELPEGYILPEGYTSLKARRGITPPGFANAFFKANP
jgi:hypothetical protein